MAAQQTLGHLHHQVETAGGLQGGGAADHRQYGQHHLHRWFARGETEHEGQQEQTDAADETQPHAPKPGTQQQAAEYHQKFHQDHSITSRYLIHVCAVLGSWTGIVCFLFSPKGLVVIVPAKKGQKFEVLQ